MKYSDGVVGPMRVWLPNIDAPGLSISRSLCDTLVSEIGVLSDPDIYLRKIEIDDKYMILASAPLWEFIDSVEALSVVHNNFIKNTENPKKACENAVNDLIRIASERWMREEFVCEDLTVTVIFLNHFVSVSEEKKSL